MKLKVVVEGKIREGVKHDTLLRWMLDMIESLSGGEVFLNQFYDFGSYDESIV